MHERDTRSGGRLLASPEEARANCGVGTVMDLDGDSTHRIVSDAVELLENLEHRGTTGAEENTGDGAGILLQTPHEFFADVVDTLPEIYAVGALFMPRDDAARQTVEETVETLLADHGLSVVHWRDVPTDSSDLGTTALDSEPAVVQAIVAPQTDVSDEEFDRRLYVARRAIEKAVDQERFFVVSLDRETLVYKGLLKGSQLAAYYPDLQDERVRSNFAMVHARFSTNTLGRWHLAHPHRTVIHNGEFNTIQGNVNWMRAREADLESPAFSESDLETLTPIIRDESQSDTASLDNALELLLASGRDLPHALRMLVPEAWQGHDNMDDDRRDWYDFHASLIEPWDGPALVIGTDGERVGAVLDRNGLRPFRYEVHHDGTLVMASEQGALEADPADVERRGRLKPGQLFMAGPDAGIRSDDEVFADLVDEKYGRWLADEQASLPTDGDPFGDTVEDVRSRQVLHGYTRDELDELLKPMVESGSDPVGSMGDDTPLSVLSAFNRPLFSYFRQQFAQVSNPPIDYIREELVTSLETRLGRQRNLLAESAAHARQLVADSPVLGDGAVASVRDSTFSTATIDVTFDPSGGLAAAVDRVREQAVEAVASGAEILILSDRNAGEDAIPIPSLLATSGVHHHLVREGLRARVDLVVESAEPRTTHHVAALIGYGAGAVNPYLGIETVTELAGAPEGMTDQSVARTYLSALEKGLLKIMAKMGISTVESYQGAQIFETVGLDSAVVDEYFTGTPNRTEGIGLDEIEADLRERHRAAFEADPELEIQGEFSNRQDGRNHAWNPQTVNTLQQAVRTGEWETYEEFSGLVNAQNESGHTLRGLLDIRTDEHESIPIEAVEPVTDIVTRFSTAAMSLGSLSPEAHENNAMAMNALGGNANTGEGGEPPSRYGTDRECGIKQVASGRFGVTSEYLGAAEELQIKMAQGSKPGEGGHLPGEKVNEMIADVRSSTPGVPLISPPPQHDIYSIEDLKQLITDLRTANRAADIHVKLVSEAGIGTIAAGCAKAKADKIHISGHSGGTGASPKTSIKHAGIPWELGLAEANQLLRETGLRSRVTLRVDGGLRTGRDVAIGALLGGEEFAFGTASLVTGGCVMARQCHQNTCPVGVATQAEKLRERYPGTPQEVINYFTFVAQELREIMADLGVATVDDLVGRVDFLAQRDVDHPKARTLDLSAVIAEPAGDDRYKTREQPVDMSEHLDHTLIEGATPALESGQSVALDERVTNVDRTVGAMLSSEVTDRHGGEGLPEDTISVRFTGTAGQSFGAFLARGVTFELDGPANDYVGKGLSGGTIAVSTPRAPGFDPAENTLVGNVALYGATGGELYVNGVAGERFAVRNSGANAVVEGVGDHGCEYMTGGITVVLGDIGRNFAAGMSGGVAYLLDTDGDVVDHVNGDMVAVETTLEPADERAIRRLVENHVSHTGSERGDAVLENWDDVRDSFVKVMPDAYRDAIAERPDADVRESLPERAAAKSPGAVGSAD
ncbi:Glutamate synthase [Halanaeroarchaeum sp. HSR-CO]|uniref:glutamate synthase large subunit n=1 Tax=Halanaeroarchaeum sp. HSR-CO TaxID=2866382 RepID=UPI00217DBFB3|nr:glutamate synthase large subunit [Halanaeroarchaeum sp. HSR-CO]UWG47339.1 Glutamate synthase [Halanaeroarchaeum sp. HSR-CO]